jgi:hypothetical protein
MDDGRWMVDDGRWTTDQGRWTDGHNLPNVRLGHENLQQVRLVKVRLVIFVHSQNSSVEHNIN